MYDVAVIGAGPAGGSTVLHCARKNLNTVLIEEHTTIGEPVHCGECLSDYALKRLELIPPKDVISLPVKGIKVIFPNKESSNVTEPGMVLEKHKFEQWLASEAEMTGAHMELGFRVQDIQRTNDSWTLKSAAGKVIQAKVLIDASGVQSVVSPKIGLNEKRFDSVIGMQYEMQQVTTSGYLDFYLWPRLSPMGYLWVIPKSNERSNVGIVTDQKTKAKVFLDQFVEEEGFKQKIVTKTFGGLIPSSGPLPHTYGEGVMLVGDAAGFTSPLFEGGTHLSLMSGKYASEVAADSIAKNDFSREHFSQYAAKWKSTFPNYTALIEGRHKIYDFTDAELNEMAAILPKELGTLGAMDKLGVGASLMLSHRNLLAKGIMQAFEAFKYSRAEFYGW